MPGAKLTGRNGYVFAQAGGVEAGHPPRGAACAVGRGRQCGDEAMTEASLTGIWHGLYTYPRGGWQPVYFVATLVASGAHLGGTTHEAAVGHSGAPLTVFASLSGSRAGATVAFAKTYDGTGGWTHTVAYAGVLNGDASEIEGTWSIPDVWSGRFLMMRSPGVSEQAVRRKFEKV
jgi:hypothetical protein